MVGKQSPHPEYGYGATHAAPSGGPWTSPRRCDARPLVPRCSQSEADELTDASPMYNDAPYQTGGYDGFSGSYLPSR